jgi:DNA-binding MarR family transcriptional regulator
MTRAQSLSAKQHAILAALLKGNGTDGAGNLIPLDLDQLIESLGYSPSKQSIQFSIRALIKRELIYRGPRVNRRNRKRVLICPTELARQLVTSGPVLTMLEVPTDDIDIGV